MAKKDEPPPPPSASAAPPSLQLATSAGRSPEPPRSSTPSPSRRRSSSLERSNDDNTPAPQVLDVGPGHPSDDPAAIDDPAPLVEGLFEAFLADEDAALAREFRLELAAADEIEFVDPRLVRLASSEVRARRARCRWVAWPVVVAAASLCVTASLTAPPGAFAAFRDLAAHRPTSDDSPAPLVAAAPPKRREPDVDEDSARASEAERLVAKRALFGARLDDAIDAAKRATTLDPRNAGAWVALASAYDAAGEPDLARGARDACGERSSEALRGDPAACLESLRR